MTLASAVSTRRTVPRGETFVLVTSCPDKPGIVRAVAGLVADHGCTIEESQQFSDRRSARFFMRVQFAPARDAGVDLAALRRDVEDVGSTFGMTWRLRDVADRTRVLILVSRYGHCLNDLLYRAAIGWLPVDVAAVVSNHPDLGRMADNHDVPFHHVPVTAERKPAAEAELLRLVDRYDTDLVVLARYMQILSPQLCTALAGRAINIHHSMLPSFKGARPYHQAHDRGVKVIGATAHYVTPDLDEGPIIEQQVARIAHSMSPEEVTALGRETECLALARAVRWHAEDRVLLNGHRTVVFS
ncbi:formyltetrahydrofolate deformylase [Pseudonocardia sp. CNS-139]|nr:formyltetrahydrofolate deformylase [Pseudonocardia sp. CNS-139]